jgi:GNAT superfamily N-acetyltransferase
MSYEYEPELPEPDIEKAIPGFGVSPGHSGGRGGLPRTRKNAPGMYLVMRVQKTTGREEHYWVRQDKYVPQHGDKILRIVNSPVGSVKVQRNGNIHNDGDIVHIQPHMLGEHDKILSYNAGNEGAFLVHRQVNTPNGIKTIKKVVPPHQVQSTDKVIKHISFGQSSSKQMVTNKFAPTVPEHLRPTPAVGAKVTPQDAAPVKTGTKLTQPRATIRELNARVAAYVINRRQIYMRLIDEDAKKQLNDKAKVGLGRISDKQAEAVAYNPDSLKTTLERSQKEARVIIDHYIGKIANNPKLAETVGKNFDAFAEHFASWLPTHTTSASHFGIMAITDKVLSGRAFRAIHALGAEIERAKVAALISPTNPSAKDNYNDLYEKVLKPKVDHYKALLQDEEQLKHMSRTEIEALSTSLTSFASAHSAVSNFLNKNYTDFAKAQAAYVKAVAPLKDANGNLKGVAGSSSTMTDLIMRFRSPTIVGLGNSMDKDVGVDDKVFGALHSSSRYEFNFPDTGAVTLVMGRHMVEDPTTTMTVLNAATHVLTKNIPTNQWDHVGNPDLAGSAADINNGKSVLVDAGDPHTITAMALHACAAFGTVQKMMSKYVGDRAQSTTLFNALPADVQAHFTKQMEAHNKNVKAVNTTLDKNDPNRLVQSTAVDLWKKSLNLTSEKPNNLPEVQISRPVSVHDVTHCIFSNKAAYDAFVTANEHAIMHDEQIKDHNPGHVSMLDKCHYAEPDPARPNCSNTDEIVANLSKADFEARGGRETLCPRNPMQFTNGQWSVDHTIKPGDSWSGSGGGNHSISPHLLMQDHEADAFLDKWSIPTHHEGPDGSKFSTYHLTLDSGHQIKVDIDQEYDRHTHGQVGALLQQSMNAIPLHLQDAVTHVAVHPPEGALNGRTYAGGKIDFFGLSEMSPTLIHHEAAHQIARKLFGGRLTPGRQWSDAMEKDASLVSQYGHTHYAEDFAEAFALHARNPESFNFAFSARARVLNSLLSGTEDTHHWEEDHEQQRHVTLANMHDGYDLGDHSHLDQDASNKELGAHERGMLNRVFGQVSLGRIFRAFEAQGGLGEDNHGESIVLKFGGEHLPHSVADDNYWHDLATNPNQEIRLNVTMGGDPTSQDDSFLHSAEIKVNKNIFTGKIMASIKSTGVVGAERDQLHSIDAQMRDHYSLALEKLGLHSHDIMQDTSGWRPPFVAAAPAASASGATTAASRVPPGALAFDDTPGAPTATMITSRPEHQGATKPPLTSEGTQELLKAFADRTFQDLAPNTNLVVTDHQGWFNAYGKDTKLTPEHVAKAYEIPGYDLSLHMSTGYQGGIDIRGKYKDSKTGEAVGEFERTFRGDEAENQYFEIDPSHRGAGIASKMYAQQEVLLERMGINKVNIHANLSVGGYAWATKGFEPTQRSMDDLKNRFAMRLGNIRKAIFDRGDRLTDKEFENTIDQYRKHVEDATSIKTLAAFRVLHPITGEEYCAKPTGSYEGEYYHMGKAILLGSDWLGAKNLYPF